MKMFEDFYIWKIRDLDNLWNSRYGFETDEIWLFSFWSDPELGLSKKAIKRLKLNIPSEENMWKLIKNYMEYKKSIKPKKFKEKIPKKTKKYINP